MQPAAICFSQQAAEACAVQDFAKLIVVAGIVLTLLGLVLWSGFGAGWLGRLPGDIRIERGGSKFYFPIVTCIVLSLLVTVIMAFFRR